MNTLIGPSGSGDLFFVRGYRWDIMTVSTRGQMEGWLHPQTKAGCCCQTKKRKNAGQVKTTDVHGADFPTVYLHYKYSFSFN